MALPRFVVLKSSQNNRYLRYLHEEKNGVPAGFLSFCGEEAWSHYSTFELERSKTSSNEDLVHIRCCYNNRYLSIMNQWIVAGAHEPVEDQSILSCTLFKAVLLDDHRPALNAYGLSYTLRFRHAQLGNFMLLLENKTVARFGGLSLGSARPDVNLLDYVCTLTDRESILTLPKHLALRRSDGIYLYARRIRGSSYLQFKSSGDDQNDLAQETVAQEVFTNVDGTLRVKSKLFGKFWRLAPGIEDFILADDSSDVSSASKHSLFWPIRVGENRIVLRNMHNHKFCKWYETEVQNALCGNNTEISDRSIFEVHELVDLRKLYHVKFRLMDSRIYNKTTVEIAREVAVNLTEQSHTVEVALSHTKMRKSRWSWSTTWMLKPGVKSSIHAEVPVIGDHGKIGIDMTAGEVVYEAATVTVTGGDVVTAVYKVGLPAKTRVKVRLIATEAWCDVPFSYTQDDTLANGEIITYEKDDGVYTGVDAFDFEFRTTEEML